MVDSKRIIMGDYLKNLAKIHEQIAPLATTNFDDEFYVDGELEVKSPDGFAIGRFVLEDEWWVFEVEYRDLPSK